MPTRDLDWAAPDLIDARRNLVNQPRALPQLIKLVRQAITEAGKTMHSDDKFDEEEEEEDSSDDEA